MRPRAVALALDLALALAGAIALAGCGAASPSVSHLRSAATRSCNRAAAGEARIHSPAVPHAPEAFLRQGVAVLRPELAHLRTIKAPSDQAGAYSAALGSLEREITTLMAAAHDLDRGADPLTTMKTLQHRLGPVEADGDAAWRTLGVPACVNR